jgi:hypothetical protein
MMVVCNPGNIKMTSPICDETTVVDDEDKEVPAFVCMNSLKLHPLKDICKILCGRMEMLKNAS